eukprot:TRINITY_DN5355_c0_g1_i1.p1 TRINITY_DN5355_c0_g1~~TRINITY_DN5355_c0_g1_i1.p1  ORF type:complete len:164 (-),score=69.85 TRINITY_DN5355_c0_g1_i1:124-615(-)
MTVHEMARAAQGGQRSVILMIDFKEIKSGRKESFRFNGDEPILQVKLDNVEADVLYRTEDVLHMMNPVTFDQFEVPVSLIGDGHVYIKDGMKLMVGQHEGQIIRVELPTELLATVTEIVSQATSLKKVKLDNGRIVSVPMYVEVGEQIYVRPANDQFLRRGSA